MVNTPAEKISMVVQEITDTVKLSQNEITAYGKREQTGTDFDAGYKKK